MKATGLDALFDATIKEMKEAGDETIVFTNFVDFDSSWGHRRDVAGYAAGLELFDRRLPELMELVGEDDILILTADHGCDPTWDRYRPYPRAHSGADLWPESEAGFAGSPRNLRRYRPDPGNVLRYVSDGIRQKHAVIICPVSLARRAFLST